MLTDKHMQQLLALEGLFKSHYKPLRAYAYRFIYNKEIAEDVVQDVFFELWSRRQHIRFDDKEAVKSYLFKSVYNRSMSLLASDLLYERSPLEGANEELIIENYMQAHMQNQEQSLLLKELEKEIAAYVETLPPQCKKVFTLSRTYELKNKEIAEQLGISLKAVEKHISKALTGLREHLRKEGLLSLFL
jgi:RNA polymerase sigma-70 factor (ECF subfamily)